MSKFAREFLRIVRIYHTTRCSGSRATAERQLRIRAEDIFSGNY
jgi:hypothetical protein